MRTRDLAFSLAAALAGAACVGTTGSDLVTFGAAAAGPADATAGQSYAFTSGRGYHVVLTRARLHVGAVYLNRTCPMPGAQETGCILPGNSYVAEVTQGLDVDALSPLPQPFPITGEGTADEACTGEVWLAHGDIDAPDDPDVILDIAGTADQSGVSYPFAGLLHIGANRAVPVADPSMPGQNPICKQRIVSPIATRLTPRSGGALLVRVEVQSWFADVDFSQLTQTQQTPPLYTFQDVRADAASNNLYSALHYQDAYDFSWIDAPNP